MTIENIVSKVQKLLRLSTANSNAEEAASAAAKAQQLIDEHNLSAAMLTLDNAGPTHSIDEPIINFADAPLHKAERLSRWRGQLAMCIAQHNGCKVWRSAGNLMIIGRPSDAETVRYLFAWLEREVERLASTHGQGYGKSWRDNFRLGVVETIAAKLKAQHQSFEHAARVAVAADSVALTRVNQALATVADRVQSVERWQKANLKLRAGSSHRTNYDAGARAQGRAAGASINIGARSSLVSGAKSLKS